MKKYFITILSCLIFSQSFAFRGSNNNQQWIIVGARGTFNSTWLLNSNMLNDKGMKYNPSWGGSGGIMLGIHLSTPFAINVEVLYSTFSQNMKSNIDSMPWTSRTNLAYLEFPVLLHFDTKKYKYVEFGVKFSNLSGAKRTYTTSPDSPSDYSNKNVKDDFGKSNLSVVFGWGSAIFGSGGGLLHLGIRMSYGLSDIISTAGGKGEGYLSLGDGGAATPKTYKITNTATIGVHLSYDFDLGWVAQSQCNRKYKFKLFGH